MLAPGPSWTAKSKKPAPFERYGHLWMVAPRPEIEPGVVP